MSTRRSERDRLGLLQGTLDLLILRTLVFGPQHGQGIARYIEQQSDDNLLIDHGSLYPALQRLETRGLIDAEWGTSENNRKARFLRVDQGRSEGTGGRDASVAAAVRRDRPNSGAGKSVGRCSAAHDDPTRTLPKRSRRISPSRPIA